MKKYLLLLLTIMFLVACVSDSAFSKPKDVRNDVTGKWKIATTTDSIDIEDYALDYYNENMKDDEIHYIVNFTNDTTTQITKMNNELNLEVRERVDKEEHDAKTLGSGMLLQSMTIEIK